MLDKILDTVLEKIRLVLYWISCVAMMVMLITIFVQVVTRYCFGYTSEWSEELARFLFVYVVFLGSALIMGESGHLAVEFLPNYFKDHWFGKVLDFFSLVCGYTFVAILYVQGKKMVDVMSMVGQESPGLEIPMSYVYAVIPVSSVLMMLYLLRNTLHFFRGKSLKMQQDSSSH